VFLFRRGLLKERAFSPNLKGGQQSEAKDLALRRSNVGVSIRSHSSERNLCTIPRLGCGRVVYKRGRKSKRKKEEHCRHSIS